LEEAAALHSRASRLVARGNYIAATTLFRRALRLANSARPPDPLLLATVLNDFGVLCKYTGRFALASRMYRRALKVILSLDDWSNRGDFVATLYHNLGGIAHAGGHCAEGLRYARRGIAIRRRVRPRDAVSLAADEAALAAILTDCGRSAAALKIYLHVLRRFRRGLGTRHYEVGAVLANLGALYAKSGKRHAAERALRRGVSILEETLGKNHPRTTSALNNLAMVCGQRRKFREADALYGRVLRILRDQPRNAYSRVVTRNYKMFRQMAVRSTRNFPCSSG
jgi:tetratricopeptide (TPR) repeat protein